MNWITYKICSQLSSTPYKRLAASISVLQISQICRPESPPSLWRRRFDDDELEWRGGDGERWLVSLRAPGDFESSTELRLGDRETGERGDGGVWLQRKEKNKVLVIDRLVRFYLELFRRRFAAVDEDWRATWPLSLSSGGLTLEWDCDRGNGSGEIDRSELIIQTMSWRLHNDSNLKLI